jgi:uncharacterized protein YggU (UPF0235/DUF167 family)
LRIRLTPRSSADRIDGAGTAPDGRAVLLVRVRALPEEGAANSALIAVIAKALKLPKTSLHLESGGKGRIKSVRVSGADATLRQALDRLSSSLGPVASGSFGD